MSDKKVVVITLHDADIIHPLKEVDAAAMGWAQTPEQVVVKNYKHYKLNWEKMFARSFNLMFASSQILTILLNTYKAIRFRLIFWLIMLAWH